MRELERTAYLDRLMAVADVKDIKVITGIRRSGKSTLLNGLERRLRRERGDRLNLIRVDYGSNQAEALNSADALYAYVAERYQKGKQNFVFIDEVQMCPDFERAVSWLHNDMKYSLYITGSNAFLLSSDLATLFTGRTYEVRVLPFSFREYLDFTGRNDLERAFADFLLTGGMPGAFDYHTLAEKHNYLAGVYETLIMRDIIERYGIKNQTLLRNLSNFLLDNISNLTSLRNIAVALGNNSGAAKKTVGNYVRYLTEAFAFYPVRRYDIKGKKYLSTQEKYYLADHAIRYAVLGTKELDLGRTYENIVALELLRRGYAVYVGTLYNKEVDFVAENRHETLFIQVAADISRSETLAREVSSLLKVKNASPKLILANTKQDEYTRDGVRIVDLARWLAGVPPRQL